VVFCECGAELRVTVLTKVLRSTEIPCTGHARFVSFRSALDARGSQCTAFIDPAWQRATSSVGFGMQISQLRRANSFNGTQQHSSRAISYVFSWAKLF